MMNLLGLAGWAAIAWLVFFSPPYLSFAEIPFPVENPIVKAGEVVRTVVRRCNSDSITHIYPVAHELVPVNGPAGARIIIMPPVLASVEPGCTKAASSINRVPLHTPPMRYYIRGYAEVQGRIRTHLVPWRSVEFEVVRTPGSDETAQLRRPEP